MVCTLYSIRPPDEIFVFLSLSRGLSISRPSKRDTRDESEVEWGCKGACSFPSLVQVFYKRLHAFMSQEVTGLSFNQEKNCVRSLKLY